MFQLSLLVEFFVVVFLTLCLKNHDKVFKRPVNITLVGFYFKRTSVYL